MADLLCETLSALMWTEDGEPQEAPPETIALRVRKYMNKPGRPRQVWTTEGPLHVALDTSMAQFRKLVNNEPGSYRLYPVDRHGRELEPVSVVEVVPDASSGTRALTTPGPSPPDTLGSDAVSGRMVAEIPHRFFDLYERMITSRDAHDELLSRLMTTLVTTTAAIQQSTAALLNSATTTVRVANGVEALERPQPPQLAVQEMADSVAGLGQLKDTLAALGGDSDKREPPWFVQLLNGPVGMGLMSVANNFAQAAAAQAAAAQAQSTQEAATAAQDDETDDTEEA